MRSNSGQGKGENNNLDPTLKDHEGKGGPGDRAGKFTNGEPFDIVGNAKVRGQDPSPDDRARGETSRRDEAAPTDLG